MYKIFHYDLPGININNTTIHIIYFVFILYFAAELLGY